MAALDGEREGNASPQTDARQHVASCASCARWLTDAESMYTRLQGMSYGAGPEDLWPAVGAKIRRLDTRGPEADRLWALGALVLGWRALQLLVDLPLPLLHPLVPVALAVAALWVVAGNPLAIQTFAPELQKRGV
jgi:hypothetical protein